MGSPGAVPGPGTQGVTRGGPGPGAGGLEPSRIQEAGGWEDWCRPGGGCGGAKAGALPGSRGRGRACRGWRQAGSFRFGHRAWGVWGRGEAGRQTAVRLGPWETAHSGLMAPWSLPQLGSVCHSSRRLRKAGPSPQASHLCPHLPIGPAEERGGASAHWRREVKALAEGRTAGRAALAPAQQPTPWNPSPGLTEVCDQ